MDQLILFDPARARRRDPLTSKLAAQKLDATRITNSVYLALCAYPGYTASELAQKANLPRESTHKRLPELRAKNMATNGPPRTCRVTGMECLTWWPVFPVEDAA